MFDLELAYDGQMDGTVPAQPYIVPLSLACPGLRDALGDSAASLRRLDIRIYCACARQFPYKNTYFDVPCALRFDLTPDSIPCAFPSLEEFLLEPVKPGAAARYHTADLLPLLEAAPGLRRVHLRDIGNVSLETVQWLLAHRPGARLSDCPEGEGGKTIEIPR
jgi:hypothetical protein